MYLEQEQIFDGPDDWSGDDIQIWADKEYAERLQASYPHDLEREKAIEWLENTRKQRR